MNERSAWKLKGCFRNYAKNIERVGRTNNISYNNEKWMDGRNNGNEGWIDLWDLL